MLLSECLADGARAGTLKGRAPAVPKCRDEAYAAAPLWWVKESQGKAFIDYQNDATAKDQPQAAREVISTRHMAHLLCATVEPKPGCPSGKTSLVPHWTPSGVGKGVGEMSYCG